MDPITPYTVSEFIVLVNAQLGQIPAQIVGEISQLAKASSGHRYFTLKDKDTGHIIECTMWARDYVLAGVELEVGMEIAAFGKASLYGPNGRFSFNAKSVEHVGEGAFKMAYEKLKKKLTLEGVFAPERKRPIPAFPHKIGIVTSLHGAVIHDFSNNLGKFGFKLFVLNAKVEGPESGRSLALSVRAMRDEDIDVLVIIRGGGSIQSLAGFDNEALVREIVAFPVPVLAGVGHHQDVTLAALAADAAESTPSFVAALINRSWEQASLSLNRSEDRIVGGYEEMLGGASRTIESTFDTIKDSLERILGIYGKARDAVGRAVVAMDYQFKRVSSTLERHATTMLQRSQNRLQGIATHLDTMARVIQAHDPNHQLKLGYSILYKDGKIVRSKKDVKIGETVSVHVADGSIAATVSANE